MAVAVIAVSGIAGSGLAGKPGPDRSGAAGVVAPSADSRAQELALRVSAPVQQRIGGSNGNRHLRAGVLAGDRATGVRNRLGYQSVASLNGCPSAHRAVKFYARRIAEHRAKMGAGPTGAREPATTCPRYLAKRLRAKAYALRRAYERWFERLYEKWRCIHEHEGAWTSNTGNGYWGGLQMDWGFQHTYGPEFIRRWGLAHRWPVWAQLVAAERAFHGFSGFAGRGYSPWGTRGMCGL